VKIIKNKNGLSPEGNRPFSSNPLEEKVQVVSGVDGRQTALAAIAANREADCAEADDQHGPGGGFGDGRRCTIGVDVGHFESLLVGPDLEAKKLDRLLPEHLDQPVRGQAGLVAVRRAEPLRQDGDDRFAAAFRVEADPIRGIHRAPDEGKTGELPVFPRGSGRTEGGRERTTPITRNVEIVLRPGHARRRANTRHGAGSDAEVPAHVRSPGRRIVPIDQNRLVSRTGVVHPRPKDVERHRRHGNGSQSCRGSQSKKSHDILPEDCAPQYRARTTREDVAGATAPAERCLRTQAIHAKYTTRLK
jgi:hypothetical protein